MIIARPARVAHGAIASSSSLLIKPTTITISCRRCIFSLPQSSCLPRHYLSTASTRRQLPIASARRYSSTASKLLEEAEQQEQEWATPTEATQAKVVETAKYKVDYYRSIVNQDDPDLEVEAMKLRTKVLKELTPLVEAWESYETLRKAILDLRPYLSDPDPTLREMFRSEHLELSNEFNALLTSLLPQLLLPMPSRDALPAILSLQLGVGGGEAGVFAEQLSRMYLRFAEKNGWKAEVLSRAEGPVAGKSGSSLREMTIQFSPAPYAPEDQPGPYAAFKWEKGVHRVQRVPLHTKEDKIHTSTVGVIVFPVYPDKPDEPIFEQSDIKDEVMRASGKGGQHVNKTESAVRLTHIPSGISVSMQDSRSQHQNREWAYSILRSRLAAVRDSEAAELKRRNRKSQVKTGDRSEKIRTYNFPQDRITDHRVNMSVSQIEQVMQGDGLEVIHEALARDLMEKRLEALLAGDEDFDE